MKVKEKEKHVVIYVRVSTERQAQEKENSLVSQEQRCREYWEPKKKDCVCTIIVYSDVETAATDARKAYQSLIANIKAGIVFAVVTTEISRLSRSVIHFAELLQICQKHQVQVHCIVQNFDSSTNTGWLMMMLFATMAQFERQQISERTSANIQARARRGLFSGRRCYGYIQRPNMPGYLDIVEEQAIVVRLLFEKYLELGTYSRVATWASDQKLPTLYGKAWKPDVVRYMLRNPAYIGKRRVKDQIIHAVWEPIVSQELWDKVNNLLDQSLAVPHHPLIPSGNIWIFSNRLFCPHCNVKLQNSAGTSKNGLQHYYYRHPRKTKQISCQLPAYIPSIHFDEILCQYLYQHAVNEQVVNEIVQEVSQSLLEDTSKTKNTMLLLQKKFDSLTQEATALISKMVLLSQDQIQEFVSPRLQAISEEKKQLSGQIEKLKSDVFHLESQIITQEKIRELVIPFTKDFNSLLPNQQKKVIQSLVKKVELTIDGITVYLQIEGGTYSTFDASKCSTIMKKAGPEGVEPPTDRFGVCCSAN